MLFPSSLMHSRVATKLESMGHDIAGTLQLCYFSFRFCIFAFSLTGLFYGAALLVLIPLVIAIVILKPYKPRFSSAISSIGSVVCYCCVYRYSKTESSQMAKVLTCIHSGSTTSFLYTYLRLVCIGCVLKGHLDRRF